MYSYYSKFDKDYITYKIVFIPWKKVKTLNIWCDSVITEKIVD